MKAIIKIPKKMPKNYWNDSFNNEINCLNLFDEFDLLNNHERQNLSRLYLLCKEILGEQKIHLFQHSPQNFMRILGDTLPLSFPLTIQDMTPYHLLEKEYADVSNMDSDEMKQTIFDIKKTALTFPQLVEKMKSKTIYTARIVEENGKKKGIEYSLGEVQEEVDKVLQADQVPVHFSSFVMNQLYEGEYLALKGLHIHWYSNKLLNSDAEHSLSHYEYRKIFGQGVWHTSPEVQDVLARKVGKFPIPVEKPTYLLDSVDNYTTIMCYYVD